MKCVDANPIRIKGLKTETELVTIHSHCKIPRLLCHFVNFSGSLSRARACIIYHSIRSDQS